MRAFILAVTGACSPSGAALDTNVAMLGIIVLGVVACAALSQAGATLRAVVDCIAQIATTWALRNGTTTANINSQLGTTRVVKEDFSDSWSGALTELAKSVSKALPKH
jgi:hypothetical protein